MDDGYEFLADDDDEEPEKPPEKSPGDITETDKYEFLHFVRQGMNRSESAMALGFRGRHFRAICSPKSMFYDEDFAKEYGMAISSLEFETNRLERLREEAHRRAMIDSDRLLEKLLMVHDPDWEKLRTSTSEVNINVKALIETHFKALPTERLEQLLAWLEEGNVIDMTTPQGSLPPAAAA